MNVEHTGTERLNIEIKKIQYSKEYVLGRKIINFKNAVLRLDLRKLSLMFKIYRDSKRISKMKLKKKRFENKSRINFDGRIAVYTSMFGNYDQILDHFFIDVNCDYYIFTDTDKHSNLYKSIDLNSFKNISELNNIEKNRYFKMLGYKYFTDYKYSVYIDSNLLICGELSNYLQYLNKKTGIAMFNHFSRLSIYDEIDVCIMQNRGNKNRLLDQKQGYKIEGMPDDFGMCECNVILRENRNDICSKLMQDWFNEFILSGSNRDQVSLPYILWKNNYSICDIGCLGENINEDPAFYRFKHKNKS